MIRIILGLLLIAISAWPAQAQIANVQTPATTTLGGTDPTTYTYPSTPTNGNRIVLAIDSANRSVSSVTSTNVTFTQKVARVWGGSNYNLSIWHGVQAGGDTSVSIDLSASPGDTMRVCFWELSGTATDQSGGATNSANVSLQMNHDSGSVTPTAAQNAIVYLSAVSATSGVTYDSGFTNLGMGTNSRECGYIIQSSATAQEANHSSDVNRNSGHVISVIEGATSGVSGGLMMLQVGK